LQEGNLPHLALAVSGQPAQNYQSHGAYRRFNLVDPEIGLPVVSLADALSGAFPLGLLKDKYVLIGSVAPSLGDHFATIYSGRQGSGTPGVVLHANLLNDILRGNLISPVPLWVQVALSSWAVLSVMIALMVLSPFLSWWSRSSPWCWPWWSALCFCVWVMLGLTLGCAFWRLAWLNPLGLGDATK
jgi:CHASE2 domain-containing sensor protein